MSAELCGLWWRNKYTIVIITIIIILMLILICTGSGAPFFLPPHPLTVASTTDRNVSPSCFAVDLSGGSLVAKRNNAVIPQRI